MANIGVDEKIYKVRIIELEVTASSKQQALEFALNDINAVYEEGTLEVEIHEDGELTGNGEPEVVQFLFDTVPLEDFREHFNADFTDEDTLDTWIAKEEQDGKYHILASTDRMELISNVQVDDSGSRFEYFQVPNTKEGLVYIAIA